VRPLNFSTSALVANSAAVSSCQLLRVAALISLLASLGACALCPSHYRSSGVVTAPTGESLPATPALSDVLAKALQPLGFKGPFTPQGFEGLYYSVGGFPSLGNRVDVILDAKSQTIFLHDFNAFGQTPFTRRVEATIGQQVRTTYGATVQFRPPAERVHECLGP
jgi:hypothetical protein